MQIMLTNDDGIRAPGLDALHRAILDEDGRLGGPLAVARRAPGEPPDPHAPPESRDPVTDLLVMAPLTVQSATSHGVTFNEPLMVRREPLVSGAEGDAIDGRPADCVKLALSTLWPDRFGPGSRPDLVISGMNAGANCGINVIYSGTVAAAIEAAFLGVPAIAVSLHLADELSSDRETPDFDAAAAHARKALDFILSFGLPEEHACLSVNVPITKLAPADPDIVFCPMNIHGLIDRYEARVSPAGQRYYWATGGGLDFHARDPGTDVERLFQRMITVTPLKYDLTDHEALARWARVIADGDQ